jgi:hypothetical protein
VRERFAQQRQLEMPRAGGISHFLRTRHGSPVPRHVCVYVCCIGAAELPEMRTIVDVHEAGNREPRYMHLCMHASHRECINWQGTGQQLASLE